ncbi:MAG: peptide chain release factor-like protein [Chloroflexi bacterium]|nr:peptide chain release factor-like protein [Chloroflexota bacterium]
METDIGADGRETPRRRFATDLETLRKEVIIETYKSTGPGGQRRDKKQTAVRVRHVPSGIIVVASERRSQLANIKMALDRLGAKLARLNRPRTRRVATRPKASALQRRWEQKQRRSNRKRSRRVVSSADDIDQG